MNKFLKRLAVGVLSLAMVAGLTAYAPATTVKAAEDLSGKLVVIHTNDMHGRYAADTKEGSLGMSAVTGIKGLLSETGSKCITS